MSYRFAYQNELWKHHLDTQGFVVIAQALSPSQVNTARTQLWHDIDRIWPGSSTNYNNMQLPIHGLAPELCQSSGAWSVRGNPTIKQVYERIWSESKLIASMDCVICWRPWSKALNQKKPRTEGLHLDQNPFHKPNLECVQGMVPLFPVNGTTGGLAVVPKSHTDTAKSEIKQRYPKWKQSGDWCPIPKRDPLYAEQLLVEAEPGDLILWDSRTVHGGVVGTGLLLPAAVAAAVGVGRAEDSAVAASRGATKTGESKQSAKEQSEVGESVVEVGEVGEEKETDNVEEWGSHLVRLSVTVSMTPLSRASPSCLQLRKEGYQQGLCFNHTPHEAGTSTGTIKVTKMDDTYTPCPLSSAQWELLDGSNGEE